MQKFIDSVKNLILLAVLLWLFFAFFVGVKMAPNDDMKPKIGAGDVLVYYRIAKNPVIQDVVVFKKNKTDYIGRVVASPGDTVEITKEGNFILNGNTLIEDEIYFSTPYYEGFQEYPLTLAADEYFILADKREGGEDSRYFGPVKQNELKGTVAGLFRRTGL